MKKKLIIVSVLFILAITGCSSNLVNKKSSKPGSLESIKKIGKIKIGIFSDDAPFCYQDANGNFKGYDVELGNKIAKELLGDEKKIIWVAMNPADRIQYLQTNKVDLMLADFTVTEERAKSVDFTLPYEKVSIGVASSEKAPIKSVDELKGKTLAVNTGTTADAYFTKKLPETKLIKIDAITDGYQALVTGRAVAFAQDNTLLLSWVKKNPGYVVSIKELGNRDYIAGAVKMGNKELLDYVNNLIKGKLKDEKFFHKAFDKTLKSSFPKDVTADQIVIEGGNTK